MVAGGGGAPGGPGEGYGGSQAPGGDGGRGQVLGTPGIPATNGAGGTDDVGGNPLYTWATGGQGGNGGYGGSGGQYQGSPGPTCTPGGPTTGADGDPGGLFQGGNGGVASGLSPGGGGGGGWAGGGGGATGAAGSPDGKVIGITAISRNTAESRSIGMSAMNTLMSGMSSICTSPSLMSFQLRRRIRLMSLL